MGNGGEQLASGRGNNALFVTRYLQDMKKSKEPFSMVFHQEEWSTYYFKKKDPSSKICFIIEYIAKRSATS